MKVPDWFKNFRNDGVLAAVVLVVLITGVAFAVSHSDSLSRLAQRASSKADVISLIAGSQAATTTSTPSTTAHATSTPPIKTVTPPVATVSTTTIQARELAGAGTQLLSSLVNIVCLSGNPSIPSISGTGVIIDSRGIILTAAHVAQLFLLQDYLGPDQVECIIRTGSPARRAYTAEPIYVSPTWIADNSDTLKTASPQGTGENDFALLGITGTATSTPVPTTFPSVPLSQGDPTVGEKLAIGSYGAEYLTSDELNYDLYPILVFGPISNRYTFGTDTIDLISVDGSAASQEGSSGGGMVNAQGQLVGTITTSSVSGSISSRSLNAITIGHMRRSYMADTGNNLDSTLASESVPALIASFAGQSSSLGAQLAQDLGVH